MSELEQWLLVILTVGALWTTYHMGICEGRRIQKNDDKQA